MMTPVPLARAPPIVVVNPMELIRSFRKQQVDNDPFTTDQFVDKTGPVLAKGIAKVMILAQVKAFEQRKKFILDRLTMIADHLTEQITKCSYPYQLHSQLTQWPYEVTLTINVGDDIITIYINLDVNSLKFRKQLEVDHFASLLIYKITKGPTCYYEPRDFGFKEATDPSTWMKIDTMNKLDLILAKFDSWYGSTID